MYYFPCLAIFILTNQNSVTQLMFLKFIICHSYIHENVKYRYFKNKIFFFKQGSLRNGESM